VLLLDARLPGGDGQDAGYDQGRLASNQGAPPGDPGAAKPGRGRHRIWS
jgi:hypothetical protein